MPRESSRPLRTHKESSMTSCLEFLTRRSILAPWLARTSPRRDEIGRSALSEPGFGEGTEDLRGWRGREGSEPIRRLPTMTEYQKGWPYPAALAAAHPATTLGAVIEAADE